MALLNLADYATKRVVSRYGLTPARRIGRGMFCAVYEDGPDAVWKLTADNIQYESVRDYLDGTHYPALVDGPGYVDSQRNEVGLYLFRAERLQPLKLADKPTRKLAQHLLREADRHWHSADAQRAADRHRQTPQRCAARAQLTLEQLQDTAMLPQSLREALADLLRMMLDYGTLSLDLHRANLMVRGTDELVLNDVVVDGAKLNLL